ncbi:hypothetical protein, partial [Exiguobacterium profundum]|uniref:hypothetical protein n=1 Tax=Exiguobacterium profundum TaxID=307643 RepID=UPI00391B6CD1
MNQNKILLIGYIFAPEQFSLLTISPPFIINVIFSVLILISVFYFRFETWKGLIWNIVLTLWSLLFISTYLMAWYIRLKHDITPEFGLLFESNSFPGWKEMLMPNLEEPHLTGNTIGYGALLYFTRKLNGWYIWVLRAFAIVLIS